MSIRSLSALVLCLVLAVALSVRWYLEAEPAVHAGRPVAGADLAERTPRELSRPSLPLTGDQAVGHRAVRSETSRRTSQASATTSSASCGDEVAPIATSETGDAGVGAATPTELRPVGSCSQVEGM